MATASDDRPGGAADAAIGPGATPDIGERLEGFRPYLLMVAGREMNPELRARCGASDLVQQAFCEAVRDRTALRGRTMEQVRGWLRGILINTIRDIARSYGLAKRDASREVAIARAELNGLADSAPTPCTQAVAGEEACALDEAMARLSDDHRRVIDLRNREGRPFAEIGQILGRSPDAARMLWFRAVEKLRQEMAETDAT